MFNMYREEEKEPKPALKQRFENFKEDVVLNLATSTHNRKSSIKRLMKEIPNASIQDTDKLHEMEQLVKRLDLDDPRRGKTLPKEYLDLLTQKLSENQQWQDLNDEKENI